MPADSTVSLVPLLAPRSIAVVGASSRPGSTGASAIRNLDRLGFGGPVWPVNPRGGKVEGRDVFAALRDLPSTPDCVMICLPAASTAPALAEAAALGVPAAVMVASGFAEIGAHGAALERELRRIADESSMAVLGPNCLGVFSTATGQASYTAPIPDGLAAGSVSLVSQSGTGAILLSNIGRFGLRHVLSTGNETVLGLAELVEHLAADPGTTTIACIVESIRDPERFSGAVRAARARGKNVVMLKLGRTEAGQRVSASHTGSLATDSAVLERYLLSIGVLRADDVDELVELIELVEAAPVLGGGGLAVVGISGGTNVLVCDLAADLELPLPPFSSDLTARLDEVSGGGTVMNPFDAGFHLFDAERHTALLTAIAEDPSTALLAVSQDLPAGLGAEEAAIYLSVAERIAAVARRSAVPVVCFTTVAGDLDQSVAAPLREAGVPILRGARPSLAALAQLLRASRVPHGHPPTEVEPPDPAWRDRLADGRPLTEDEALSFFADHGLPVPRRSLARDPEEAAAIATSLATPVALKVQSAQILHKTEAGGVALGVVGGEAARVASVDLLARVAANRPDAVVDGILVEEMVDGGVEVILGTDATGPFGPSIVVGVGGIYSELVRRSAVDLAASTDAAELVNRSGLDELLDGFRGAQPADRRALLATVERFARVVRRYAPWIVTAEINPLVVRADGLGVCAADALIIPRRKDHS